MGARRAISGDLVAHQPGAVPAAAGAGRGARFRDPLPPGQARQGRHCVGARFRPRAGARQAGGAAEEVRLGARGVGGLGRRDRRRAGNRAAARGDNRGRAGEDVFRFGGDAMTETNNERGAYATPDIVIITGMSGAGRSTAAKSLEDLGWFVVDNLPPALLPTMLDLADRASLAGVAAIVDVRSRAFSTDLKSAVSSLGARGVSPHVVFLEASDAVLVQRFENVRRP